MQKLQKFLSGLVRRVVGVWRSIKDKLDGSETTSVYPPEPTSSPTVTGNEFHAAFHTHPGG